MKFIFLVFAFVSQQAYARGDVCKCPVQWVREKYGCNDGYLQQRSCYYNGATTKHGQSYKGSSHTCNCKDGNWVNCQPNAKAYQNIVETAIDTPQLSTLVSVLTTPAYAPVLKALQGNGPFTVFAPTNAAFAAAGVDVSNVAAVTNVLQYHVLSGKVLAGDLAASQTVQMLQGDTAVITKNAQGVRVNNNANVVIADVEASNGVVHVIDSVLMPPHSNSNSNAHHSNSMQASCWHNGQSAAHQQWLTGATHTCLCDNGSWVRCRPN